jgi:hypothetical protein
MPENSRPRPLITGRAASTLTGLCHYLHTALVIFVLVGWLVPVADILLVHLAFVPMLVVTWLLNANTCPLNNIESRLTKGVWRDPENREEGSFLVVLVEKYLGLHPTQGLMDTITYLLMGAAWLLSLGHYALRMQVP